MAYVDYHQLTEVLVSLGATRIIFKPLSENDNTKQQVYLGGSFEALNQLPYGEITASNLLGKQPNFKAPLQLFWLLDGGQIAPAPHAQLILYPKYPEVRLSGFLKGCKLAPSEYFHPVPADERTGNDGRDSVMNVKHNLA